MLKTDQVVKVSVIIAKFQKYFKFDLSTIYKKLLKTK